MLAYGTRQAVFVVKDKGEVGCSPPSFAFRAAYALFSLWTGDLFVLPINMKLGVVESALDAVLPRLAGRNRPHQINPLALAVHQQIHFHIAFIHKMSFWGSVFGCQS